MTPQSEESADTQAQVSPSRRTSHGFGQRLRSSNQARTQVPLIVALVALGLFATSRSELFLTGPNIRVLLDSVAVLGLITVGTTILLIAGQLDLSVGASATLVSVFAAKVIMENYTEPAAVLVGIAIAVAISVVVGIVVITTRVQPFILTLGLLSVLQSIALLQTGQRPIPIGSAFRSLDTAELAGVPVSFWCFILALVLGFLILQYTSLGRNIFAIGSNREAAFLSGVRVGWVTVTAYAFSGILVGVAGIFLLAGLGAGDASSGKGLELQAIAAAVIGGATLVGGRGSMFGSFLGVMLLGLISNALTLLNVSSFYQLMALGGLLIFAVVSTAIAEGRREEGVKFKWRRVLLRNKEGTTSTS